MTTVTLNGNAYSDAGESARDMQNGGHRSYLLPMLQDAVADLAAKQAAASTANGVLAITYTFSTTTADSDPGAGVLRLSAATQNTSTAIRVDLTDQLGVDWASVLDTFDAATSTIKGQIRLSKVADGAKWLTFNVTARAAPPGYRNFTVTNTGGSSSSPFMDGDPILLAFTRTGDKGETGPAYSGAITGSGLTQSTARLLGRTTAGGGAVEEISVSGATLSGGTLTITPPTAAGGASLTLLATLTPTVAANVDALNVFSSSYDNYLIIGQAILPGATDALRLRFAAGGTVDTGNKYFASQITGANDQTAESFIDIAASNVYNAGKGASFVLTITNANDATNGKMVFCPTVHQSDGTPTWMSGVYWGAYVAANTISGIRFFWGSGNNFAATGKIRIYGYNNS